MQHVWLARDPAIKAYGVETWSSSRLETADPSNVRLIRDSVAELVDRFINAYLG